MRRFYRMSVLADAINRPRSIAVDGISENAILKSSNVTFLRPSPIRTPLTTFECVSEKST